MFFIPDFYEMDMDFQEAVKILAPRGADLLEAMKRMDRIWAEHVRGDNDYDDDDEFFNDWQYEVNAYNVVYEGMAKLFAPKENV